jgi:hypothetical protein
MEYTSVLGYYRQSVDLKIKPPKKIKRAVMTLAEGGEYRCFDAIDCSDSIALTHNFRVKGLILPRWYVA